MTREQQLEKALRDLLMETSAHTIKAAYDLLDICHVCNRDRAADGPCAECDNEPKRCGCCGVLINQGALCGACRNSD